MLPRELEYIQDRRATAFPPGSEGAKDLPGTADKQLLGLAFSGGGIRSATFNLGVLQALERRGVFQFVDYLSTVSGGGFLGCSLSKLLSHRASRRGHEGPAEEFPFKFSEAEEEVPAVSYLRNNSNYLAPRGLLDYLRIFAVLVRGILLNFLVLLPFLLICSLLITVIYGQPLLDRLREDDSRAEVTELLERNWLGIDSESPVEELISALQVRGMLDTHRGMTRAYVAEWLMGLEKRGGKSSQPALPALIKGSEDDDEEQYDEYEFREGVTIEEIVERLWQSGTLRNLDALREIDSVEQQVRLSPKWKPSSKRIPKGAPLNAGNLYQALASIRDPGKSRVDPETPLLAESATPERVLEALKAVRDPERLIRLDPKAAEESPIGRLEKVIESIEEPVAPVPGAQTSLGGLLVALEVEDQPETLVERQLPPEERLDAYQAAGRKPNLRRILQELHARAFFNPAWLDQHWLRKRRSQTAAQPPVYGEPYELAAVEKELARTGVPLRQSGPLVVPRASRGPLDERRAELVVTPGSPGWSLRYPRLALDGTESLHQLAHLLWDNGLIDEAWLARRFRDEPYPLAYAAHRRTLAAAAPGAGTLNPYRNALWATRWLLKLGLLSVMLYPLLLLFRRPLAAICNYASRKGALWWRDLSERFFSALLILIAGVAFIELQPYIIYHYARVQADNIWWPLGIGAASLVASMVAGPAIAYFRGFGKTVVLVVVGLLAPILPFLVYVHVVKWVVYQERFWSGYYLLDDLKLVLYFGLAAAVVHVINLPIDINSTSLHGFYRDRLSAAYLMRWGKDGSVVPGDDLPLTEICAFGSGAPYHVINTTLNLQGSKDPTLRRRRGDFFQLGKFFVGSKHTGFCRTTDLRKVFPHVHLSSAMAVSAAAAAPNMGTFNSGPLVVMMALLNIRLGYWIPNPMRINRRRREAESGERRPLLWIKNLLAFLIGSFKARPGAYILLNEMFSRMRPESRLVNLSDGGHMENTGAFELLRRRCRFIIVGDAEADPAMRFGGLAALIRYARIDFGVEIDIHPDDLRLDDEGESRQHCALGVIRYPKTEDAPESVGYLLYIKASITGDESEVVSEYHRKSPLFPHESTADQFFDEGQFEAYRDLGFHICDGLFDEIQTGKIESFSECSEWFEILAISLSPGLAGKVTFADIQGALSDIERMLREPGYSHYFYEIYPELKPAETRVEALGPEDEAEAFRNVFHLVNIQLQLMESLFVSNELGQKATREHPANRGWMNLFRRWAKAPSFKRGYLPSITTYSAPFQQFCQVALGLGLELRWEPLTEMRRRRLASQADEIGLRRLETAAPEGGLDLALTAHLKGTDPILIGESVVTIDDGKAEILDLEMRPGYQGAGMRARATLALKGWARSRGLELGFSQAASVAARGEDFDRDHSDEHGPPAGDEPPGEVSSRPTRLGR